MRHLNTASRSGWQFILITFTFVEGENGEPNHAHDWNVRDTYNLLIILVLVYVQVNFVQITNTGNVEFPEWYNRKSRNILW